jgi:hypothetical protein
LDGDMATSTLQIDVVPTNNQILQPVDCMYNLPFTDGANATAEWMYSDIQIPTDGGALPPEEFGLHIVGPDLSGANQSKGMIRGYGLSRSRPINTGEPNAPGEGWMTQLFDLADNLEEVRDDIISDNDRPPYPVEDNVGGSPYNEAYPGGTNYSTEVVGYASFGVSSGANAQSVFQRSIKGGMFPCGLIEIKSDLTGPSYYDLIVHLVPGHHRGYLCQPMEEV